MLCKEYSDYNATEKKSHKEQLWKLPNQSPKAMDKQSHPNEWSGSQGSPCRSRWFSNYKTCFRGDQS